jgi:hypothetical protein
MKSVHRCCDARRRLRRRVLRLELAQLVDGLVVALHGGAAQQAHGLGSLLVGLKDECAAIEAVSVRSAKDLLQHVYAKHPPKHPPRDPRKNLIGELDADSMARTLRSAILHYHPDKYSSADPTLRALMSFITKRLTPYYQMFSCGG